MRRAAGPPALALARFRRRPSRWLLPALGVAIAVAFACAVAGEGSIAADRAARNTLAAASPADRTVRVTAQGAWGGAEQRVRALLAAPGFGAPTQVVLLNPVRLGPDLVQLAAISPLSRWTGRATAACTASRCPVLLAGLPAPSGSLAIPGAAVRVVGRAALLSPVPLGFRPLAPGAYGPGETPPPALLLTGDAGGLERLPGVQAVYRTTSWLAPLDVAGLHSWQLGRVESGLQRAQAGLLVTDPSLSLSAPFVALDAARAQAAAAPRRLLLAGGGAAAAIVAFVLLAAGALRRDVAQELLRLRTAGATSAQRASLAIAEAAGVSGLGVLAGAVCGVALVAVLAGAAGEPVGQILGHSLGTAGAAAGLLGGWMLLTLLLAGALVFTAERRGASPAGLGDVLALAAVAALALALARGDSGAASDPLPVLVAPLCCLAAGALVFRVTAALLRGGERVSRPLPFSLRLALVNLARAPATAAAAAAFLTISVGLGAFALSYRATMSRSAADQAADQVPLDVTVSAGPSLAPPLLVAPIARWRAIARGPVLPVRRTQASLPSGATTATVSMIALPARALPLLRGWRDSDASAGRAVLAARLTLPGPVRRAGPTLPAAARAIAVTMSARGVDVNVSAILRDASGNLTTLALGAATSAPRALRAVLPPGRWELAALQLSEPAGLAATSGHQNAENPGAGTRLSALVSILSAVALGDRGRPLSVLPVSSWTARGAAADARARGPGLAVRFTASGQSGLLRPPQPGDGTPLPVLVDRATAAQAGPGGRLPLTVDGVAIDARVVGRLRRFPTVGSDAGGFAVADEVALAARLDAAAPGGGRADELWLSAPRLALTRAALRAPALASLSVVYRADIERALRSDAVLAGVADTLEIAALVAVMLAAVGLLTTVLGSARDRGVEHDLAGQGAGPRALRLDLRLRALVIAGLGVAAGLAAGVVLARLAVAAVRGSATQAPPSPALVTVIPAGQIVGLALLTAIVLGAVAWIATSGHQAEATR